MKKVYIWSKFPIVIDLNLYDYIATKLNTDVFILHFQELGQDRKVCGYSEEFGRTRSIKLNSMAEAKEMLESIFQDINIFFGILHENRILIDYLISLDPGTKIGIISERYNPFGNYLVRLGKKFLRSLQYAKLAAKWKGNIAMFLAYGEIGMTYFEQCGFQRNVLYPTIYCVNSAFVDPMSGNTNIALEEGNRERLKFIYVGRLCFGPKGVDILIKAFDRIRSYDWSLDIAGGYGEDAKEIVEWANSRDKVNYIGLIGAKDVINTLTHYDVCVVPSRREGYNTLPGQSIAAQIGCIATDETVSSELIRKAKSGIVVKAGSISELKSALEYTIENKFVVRQWKKNAAIYSKNISVNTVGEYIVNIIERQFLDYDIDRPSCPWL